MQRVGASPPLTLSLSSPVQPNKLVRCAREERGAAGPALTPTKASKRARFEAAAAELAPGDDDDMEEEEEPSTKAKLPASKCEAIHVRPTGPGNVPFVYAKSPKHVVLCKTKHVELMEVVIALRMHKLGAGKYNFAAVAQNLATAAEYVVPLAKSLEKFVLNIKGL